MNHVPVAPCRVLLRLFFCLAALVPMAAAPLKILFLGDSSLHVPVTRLRELAPAPVARGIQLIYTPVRLVFRNDDHMQHNVLVLRPGTLEAVGAITDRFFTDSGAMASHYVPDTPNVLASTPLVNPGETFELRFTAPATPGRYPYVCTFPGHWRLMQGTLVVTP